ncbi:MAG: AraC family transcriptional regulator [Desulfovibrionaceae bacterium]|nr:AraC family transcriptional regulator [Desulfovibrionaceae bacterium]
MTGETSRLSAPPIWGELAMDWPCARASYETWPHSAAPPTDAAAVPGSIGVSFAGHLGTVRTVGGRIVEEPVTPGAILIAPDAPMVWLHISGDCECLDIDLAEGFVLQATQGGLSSLASLTSGEFHDDPVITGIALRVKTAVLGTAGLCDLDMEMLLLRLLDHILCAHRGTGLWGRRSSRGCLSPQHMKRVVDYVESRLGERLTLQELARQASMSPFHFARAFRSTSGLAPNAYVTARRLESAKQLLLSTSQSIEHIAAMFGFQNLSHFRRKFIQQHGVLPGVLRAARR